MFWLVKNTEQERYFLDDGNWNILNEFFCVEPFNSKFMINEIDLKFTEEKLTEVIREKVFDVKNFYGELIPYSKQLAKEIIKWIGYSEKIYLLKDGEHIFWTFWLKAFNEHTQFYPETGNRYFL